MAWDEIKFKISADMDFGNAVSQVDAVKKSIGELKGDIADMPNVSRILDNSLEKTLTVATSLSNKLERLQNGKYRTNDERTALEKSIGHDISELNTMRSLQNGNGDFSVSLARSWFGGLPSAVQKELDSVIPQVASIIRTRVSTLNGLNSNAFKGKTQTQLASEAIADPQIKALSDKYLRSAMAKQQYAQMIQDIIPHVIPANRLNAYQLRKYGSLIPNENLALSKGKAIDLFPESFKEAYKNRGYEKRRFTNNDVLSKDAVKEFNRMIVNSPIMAKAAVTSGVGRRNSRGVLETKQEISRQDWENYRSALYSELMSRVAGFGKGKIDPYSIIDNDIKKITSRLTSSTSGDTMVGLHNIERFEKANSWTTGTGSNRYTHLSNEGRRIMDEYVVNKYSPFMKTPDGKAVAPQEVMISESHNTRLLGQGRWKNNDDVSGTIALISLQGYDPSDKKQQKELLNLYKNGKVINGVQYVAQSAHGKGDDRVIRMIEKTAYDRVALEEDVWARRNNIRGSYWGGFDDAEIERKRANGTISAQDWGKHLEMLNKSWTPTVDSGVNLKGKKIAVVDFNKFGDGATWASNKMIADSGQVRLGVGGKGSVFVFDGKNIGDFAQKAGIADEQGRVMMLGPDKKLFDVSGYDMIMPLDVIKNKGAYMDASGNMLSGEKASEIATALVRRYGIGMAANYSKEDISSNRIGTQMASFIDLMPELQNAQIEKATKRMQELDTEAGQLRYVFGDKNDWLSRAVNNDPQLLNTDAAKRRVDAHKQALMQKIIGGEYINFDNESGIADMRLAASPLASFLLSHGGITPEVINKARGYLAANAIKRGVDTPNYTDEEIANLIIPKSNTVLDFAHINQPEVAVIRSPTGYGNMLNAKNLAAQALPIWKGMGLDTTAGIYVSQEDLDTLQSADFDADQAKVIYNKELRESVAKSLETQKYVKQELDKNPVQYTKKELKDEAMQRVFADDRSQTMSPAMGTGSSGIRIRQLDLNNPHNKEYIEEAQRLAAFYDTWTVFDKNAEETPIEIAKAWNTLKLGKEYTKFSDKVSDLFSFEQDLLDENGNVNRNLTNDVFHSNKTGLDVNLRTLRQMGIDNINLPSAFMANHLAGMAQAGRLYRSGLMDTSYMDTVSEAMDQLGYGDAEGEGGKARQRLMKTMRHLLPEFGTGARSFLTPAEARAIGDMADKAFDELQVDSKKYLSEDGSYSFVDPATGKRTSYKDAKSLAMARAKYYGINSAYNAVNLFGMTEDRLRFHYGDNYADVFKNSNLSAIELLPEDKLAAEIAEQQTDLGAKIEDAKAKVESESKKNKPKNKRQIKAEEKMLDKEISQLAEQLHIQKEDNIDNLIAACEANIKMDQGVVDSFVKRGGSPTDDTVKGIQKAIQTQQDTLKGYQNYKSLLQKKENVGKSGSEQQLAALLKQKEELDKREAMMFKAIDARTEYEQLRSDARAYSQQIWGYQKGKENKIRDDKSYAEKYWSRSFNEGKTQMQPFMDFAGKLETMDIPEESKQDMMKGIAAVQTEIFDNIQKDFTNKSILYAKTLSESIEQELTQEQNAPTAQKRKLDEFDEGIKNAKSFIDLMEKQLKTGNMDEMYKKMYKETIAETSKYIGSAENAKSNLIAEYTAKNEKMGRRGYENLLIRQGYLNRNSLAVRTEARQEEIQNFRNIIDKEHNEGNYSDAEYSRLSSMLDELEGKATKTSIAIQDTMNRAGQVIGRLTYRIGRQLFQKAIQETKQFVKQFDASMNEIQAITLKSGEDMQAIRSQTIEKALGLRTSVSNVAGVEAMLYRQGLSDSEVSSRTDSIIKFATVTKLNVQEATKIITTALQNDLVNSATAAMDALVALGDNAATTAAEIGKGMQKAAASAKVAGVSYAELTALLTIGTSDTQLSGTQVGTALQTIFTRMRRMSISGWVADQNGKKTTASDAEAALKSVGVDLWEDKAIGKMRTAYDVLRDLSKVWQDLSDAQKNIVMNAMAGTRQTNVFSTLIEGMSEDGGATLDKYLGLAEGSEGITQTKYEIAMQSLSAAMDEVKSSWDALVESFITGGSITGFLDDISGFLQLIANAGDIGRGLSIVAGGITGIGVALAAISSANPALKALSTILGIASGLAATGLFAGVSNLLKIESPEETEARLKQELIDTNTKNRESRNDYISSRETQLEKVEKLGKAYDDLRNSQDALAKSKASDDLTQSLQDLTASFPDLSAEIQNSINNLDNWSDAIKKARKEVDQLKEDNVKETTFETINEWKSYSAKDFKKYIEDYSSKHGLVTKDQKDIIQEHGFNNYGHTFVDYKNYNDDVKTGLFNDIVGSAANKDLLSIVTGLVNNNTDIDWMSKAKFTHAESAQERINALSKEAKLQIMQSLYDMYNSANYDLTQEDLARLGFEFAENVMIPEHVHFDQYATETFSAETVKKAFLNALQAEILKERNGEANEYGFLKNGFDTDAFSAFLTASFLAPANSNISPEDYINSFVQRNITGKDVKYHIGDILNPDYITENWEDAVQYVLKNNLGYDAIRDEEGNIVYQTADQLISAKIQEANENNEKLAAQKVLYGQTFGTNVRDLAVSRIGARGENESEEQYRRRLDNAIFEITNEQKNLPGAIRTYGSLDAFKEAYRSKGLDGVLANVIAGNPMALLGWLQNDVGFVATALEEAEAGLATPQSTASAMKLVMDVLNQNPDKIQQLRNEEEFSEAYKNLQSYFGDNTDNVLNAMLRNEYTGSEYENLVKRTVAENGIALGIGKQFTNAETAALAQRILSSDVANLAAAQQGLGWTTDEWDAITSKYPELKRYLEMTPEQQESVEGQNLLRNVEIQISVSGVKDLEEANKVLAGTSDLIAGLAGTEDQAIKAKINFGNTLFANQQQEAMFRNGSANEQIDAISAITGLSREQIQQNPESARALAEQLLYYNGAQTGASLDELAKDYPELAEDFAKIYGYVKNNKGNYVATDESRNPVRADLAFGTSRSRSATQIALNRQKVIDQTLTNEKGNYEEYEEAYNALGQYGKDYLAMLQDREKYSEEELNNAKQRAEAENRIALIQAKESDALTEAELKSGTSIEATNKYAQLRYQQSNKAGLAANALYKSLFGIDAITRENIENVFASEEGIKNWEELLKSAPELTEEFKRMGHAVDENGNIDWASIENDVGGLDSALSDLISIIAKHSTDYQNAVYQSRSDIYAEALAYNPKENTGNYDSYAAVVGADIAAKERAQNYILTAEEEAYKQMRLENFGKGIDGLTELQKLQGANDILASIRNGTYEDKYLNASSDMRDDYIGAAEGLDTLIQKYISGEMKAEDFAEMQKYVSAQLNAAAYSAEHFGEAADDVSASLAKLAKGGKTARQELTRINEAAYDVQDAMTAWEEAYNGGKVKSGKQLSKDARDVISKQTGATAEAVKKWTAEEMANHFANEDVYTDINDQMNTYVTTLLNDAIADIQSVVGEDVALDEEIDIGGTVAIICNPDGTINMDGLIALANAAQSDAIGILEAMAQGKLAEWVAKFETAENGKEFKAWIEANTTTFAKKGKGGGSKYNKRSGGGGGGGKSEIDKLLEKQKHDIGAIQHNLNMLQTAGTTYDFVNDYGAQLENINQQIAAQEQLRSAYAANITELEAQLATVESGSDDWYKLTDAIYSAQEAMAAITNTINQLNSSKITIIEQRQEYQSGPKGHKGTILEARAQRYQLTGQFEAYTSTVNSEIQNNQDKIAQNKQQIKEWEDLLKQTIKGSDDWYKIRDKIWKKKEENEQLQNEVISAQIELEKAKIDQIAADLENSNRNYEHINNIMSTYAGIYESSNSFDKYREAITTQSDNLKKMREANSKAIEEMKNQINSMAEDDPAREHAIQALYQLEETQAQIDAELFENQASVEQSYISEIQKLYERQEKANEHESKLLDSALNKYERKNDFVNANNIYLEKIRNTEDSIADYQAKLEDYTALMDSGKIKQGSQAWFDLQDAINSTTEAIAELENTAADLEDKRLLNIFENIKTVFNRGTGNQEGMDQLQHEGKLIDYQISKYQNRGELTNVGTMYQYKAENLEQKRQQYIDYIQKLKDYQSEVADYPEIWDKVNTEIRTAEESLASITNEIEKNSEAIKKNEEAIRQARMKVENEADKAIRAIIQKERNMLSATVSIQNTILETIRNSYKEQWDFEKKTIEKKKQALAEEKNLISERMNLRKKMLDQEAKDEELAEYKRQLALISADTTRTKEANELRRKISEMEKEQAYQDAQDIANAEIQAIEDRSKAWDNYVSVQEEDLNDLLSNANNFVETLDQLMTGSFEDFVAWNMKYNKNFKNATDEQRKQMEQGWDDTWYNMLGILRTYWDEVSADIRAKDSFLALVTSLDDYQKLSETGKQSYLYNMSEMYDNFTNSLIDNATFDDTHEVLNKIDELKDWVFTVKLADYANYFYDPAYSQYVYNRNKNGADPYTDDNYDGWGTNAPSVSSGSSSGGGSGSGNGSGTSSGGSGKPTVWYVTGSGYVGSVQGWENVPKNAMHASENKSQVEGYYSAGVSSDKVNESHGYSVSFQGKTYTGTAISKSKAEYEANQLVASLKQGLIKSGLPSSYVAGLNASINAYKEGGLADYTGLAWVDGTKTKPEGFLDATDTELLRNMLDTFTYVKNSPYITRLDQSNFGKSGVSIGDVNVNLYEAKLENDADYELVAQKVGNAFAKELQKSGFNLGEYAW